MNPTNPDASAPKPWHKPQEENEENDTGSAAGDAGSAAGDLISGAADAAGGALEGASAALDAAGGCADGCGGCSAAILITLFAAASTAMAFFR